jgi:hypothetical protein
MAQQKAILVTAGVGEPMSTRMANANSPRGATK